MARPDEGLVLGASGRAAAHSALRAGLTPVVIDLFADLDLAAVAECRTVDVDDYPEALFHEAKRVRADAWFYTGALENRPDLVDAFSERVPLWGIGGEALRGVRDPFRLASCSREAGFLYPEVCDRCDGLPRDGSWLRKPRSSGGGFGVHPWRGPGVGVVSETRGADYFQKEVYGLPVSALFVGDGRGAIFRAASLSRVGIPGGPFVYRGSLAPWSVSPGMEGEIARIGSALAGRFGLRGLFGIDLVCDVERPWLVEVNPRYTASVEVVELALGVSLVGEHAAAFGVPTPLRSWWLPGRRFVAKEVLYAERSGTCGDFAALRPEFDPMTVPPAGDLPRPGTPYQRGDPLVTVMATGATVEECETTLSRRLGRWRSRFGFV